MEDSGEEWEEYSPPGGSSKVSWVLNKGLGLGKKIVISGILISSAPLVLPSLVVFSAFGLALSVPFGVFFTSYACTEKLMSKLLSTITPPSVLKYEILSSDEDEISGDALDFEEEERLMKDIKEGIEMRIELVEKGNDGFDQEGELTEQENYEQGGVDRTEQEPMMENDEDLAEENGKPLGEINMKVEGEIEEENVGKIEEKGESVMEEIKDQKPINEVCGVVIVIEGDAENNINVEVGEPLGVTRGVNEGKRGAGKAINIEEGEKLVRETRGLSIRDEGYIGTAIEDDKQRVKETSGATEKRDKRNVGNAKKMEKPSGSKKKKPIRKMGGAIKKKDEDISNKIEETKERRCEGNNGSSPKVAKPVENIEGKQRNINGKHVDSIVEVEIPHEETRETTNVGSSVEKEQKPKEDKKTMLKGRTEDSIVNDVDEGFQLERVGEAATFSNADAREIVDESGFDLADNKNKADEHYSNSVMETTEGTERLPSFMDKKIAANVDHPVSAGIPESPSRKGTTMPSDKAIYSEDKIWENIRALRTIVGYRVAQQATCMEELRALYIFTGVELPVSFKDSSDLVEINDKLRFLMSVVGVK